MNSRLSKLAVAAVLAASVPAAASARDCDEDRHVAYPPAHVAVAHPASRAPAPPPRFWREARWRDRELAGLRAEFRALEDERARFYAVSGRRPGKVRKFERWYAARRAELESRWHAAHAIAWR